MNKQFIELPPGTYTVRLISNDNGRFTFEIIDNKEYEGVHTEGSVYKIIENTKILAENLDDLIKAIEKLTPEDIGNYKIFDLHPRCRFDHLSIDLTTNNHDDGYSWMLSPNYKHTRSVMNVYPMQSSQMVKMFKTLGGCKRNLIKRLKESAEYGKLFYNMPENG